MNKKNNMSARIVVIVSRTRMKPSVTRIRSTFAGILGRVLHSQDIQLHFTTLLHGLTKLIPAAIAAKTFPALGSRPHLLPALQWL